ncbi:hypothetical protein RM697_02745 [Ichthyenterobacterium sp. W332]|uniref:DUF4440 domain-containing protein n=1 Tax=Microcosmobacter mediterraneus TaxID=3075607 RepID=A0ABU2YIF1_9FLAO|nr:hypothetical protein [Ichthyenterobacterium sp. W332]MDT0557550.1 hypothetical protein [Ichthyenterobacterium sp. W332]
MKLFSLLILLLIFNVNLFAQDKHEALKAINADIWQNFTKAYETLDYDLFASIHDSSLLRVSGNQKTIRSFENYMNGYKDRWKTSTRKQTITFRFIERIVNKTNASERGIYKLTINPGKESEESYYGKFHVLHKNINGKWKIIFDYDSTENNSIDESSYTKAFSINDFLKY